MMLWEGRTRFRFWCYQAGFSDRDLLQEIQKFMTVHLDPQGIILYMDVLGNQPVARNAYKQGGQMW